MTDTELTLFATEWCEKEPPTGRDEWDAATAGCSMKSEKKFWKLRRMGPGTPGPPRWEPAYNFATDLNACALFEALVEGREVWSQYVDDMLFVLGLRHEPGSVPITPFEAWALYRAPPRARCKALIAMAGGDDES